MAALDYLDFDLEVEATGAPDIYKVSVLASPRGEATGQMTFPFNNDALENVILKLGRTRSGVRAIGSPTQDVAKKFGSSLYDALFAGEVGTCFRRSLDEADTQGKGLRIRLRLEDAPQLADVPWEYLYPTGLRQFLVLSTRTPVVRYLELQQRVAPLQVTPPLQVLVAVSSPTNLPPLDVDAEVQRIRGALAGLEQAGQVHVTVLTNITLMELRRAMRGETKFHVLHFIGHGGFDDSKAEGMLAFEDERHGSSMVSGTTLATTIRDFDSLRLVLLNACEGARQSPADPLGGVAQSLVMQGNIPAVVAMQFEITDAAATVFSSEFYAAIADGYPIDAALAEARVAVFSDNNDVEWGTPVLYLRASDGRIFDVAGGGNHTPVSQQQLGTPSSAATEGAGPRVVPVVLPPWPNGGGGGGTASIDAGHQPGSFHTEPPGAASGPEAAGGSGHGTSPADTGYGAGASPGDPNHGAGDSGGFSGSGGGGQPGGGGGGPQPRYEAVVDPAGRPGGRGVKWAILAAVAAVLALAVFLWPQVFPGGNGASVSPEPTNTQSENPSPTAPTPSRSTRTTPTLPPVRDVGTLKALRITQPLTIDGNTDDWQWQLVAQANNQITDTRSAATGDIYLMWDDEALYLLAMVDDPDQRRPDPKQPNRAWRGDSVVLELGPDKSRLGQSDPARPQDAYYIFGLPTDGIPVTAILGPNAQRTDFSAPRDSRTLDAAISIIRTGYVLEAKIPWKTTGLNGVGPGAVFAANVQVSERMATSNSNLGMRSTNAQRMLGVRMFPAYWQGLELQR